MKPFLLLPVCLGGGQDKDEKEVVGRYQPDDIAGYYPGYNWGSIVVLKSGTSFLTTAEPEQLDSAMVQYNQMTSVKSQKFGNISIISKN